MTTKKPLTQQPAWKALMKHHREVKNLHLRELFAKDSQRGERLPVEAVGLYLDYSKNLVTDETLRLLLELAQASGLRSVPKRCSVAKKSTSPKDAQSFT